MTNKNLNELLDALIEIAEDGEKEEKGGTDNA